MSFPFTGLKHFEEFCLNLILRDICIFKINRRYIKRSFRFSVLYLMKVNVQAAFTHFYSLCYIVCIKLQTRSIHLCKRGDGKQPRETALLQRCSRLLICSVYFRYSFLQKGISFEFRTGSKLKKLCVFMIELAIVCNNIYVWNNCK